jgi:hypothetical protein
MILKIVPNYEEEFQLHILFMEFLGRSIVEIMYIFKPWSDVQNSVQPVPLITFLAKCFAYIMDKDLKFIGEIPIFVLRKKNIFEWFKTVGYYFIFSSSCFLIFFTQINFHLFFLETGGLFRLAILLMETFSTNSNVDTP